MKPFRKPSLRTVAEVVMGLAQVTGQLIGSTTLAGACVYEVLAVGWWVWMITGRCWGFLPLNICGTAISTYTILKITVGF